MHLDLVTIIVNDYEPAIDFFVNVLKFELAEDTEATTNDGRLKRWVVVRPSGSGTGFLVAKADGEQQEAAIGNQFGGRVGLFLRVDDFDEAYQRMQQAGVEFTTVPRTEPYGTVAVFRDIWGNSWDLLSAPSPPNV